MGKLEKVVGYKIKGGINKTTLNISHLDIILKTTKVFYDDIDSLMKFGTPDTLHKGIIFKQETRTLPPKYLNSQYWSVIIFLPYFVNNTQPEIYNVIL